MKVPVTFKIAPPPTRTLVDNLFTHALIDHNYSGPPHVVGLFRCASNALEAKQGIAAANANLMWDKDRLMVVELADRPVSQTEAK